MKQQQYNVLKLLVASSGITASAGLSCHHQFHDNHCSKRDTQSLRLLATSAGAPTSRTFSDSAPLRSYKTSVDEYYKEHQELPLPPKVHDELPNQNQPVFSPDSSRKNILVIGDVHGCYQELLMLYEKAKQENQDQDFQYVILVGDLVNKGPQSVQVVRHVRNQSNWLSIRGNHDDAALKAALGDPKRADQPKYQWVQDFSDDDLLWLSQLPYTLRIPAKLLDDDHDTLIVHAGLIPQLPLEQQSIPTMITLRDVAENTADGSYEYYKAQQEDPIPWASVWNGPFRIVFGHDAKRQLQQYPWATGLDTGACYGKKLTGLILPQNKLVQVDSLEVYCPITDGEKKKE